MSHPDGRSIVRVLATSLLAFGYIHPLRAADVTVVDPSPELTAAQNRAALATAEADFAKAQVDIFKAKIGELNTDLLPKGTIDAKTLGIEGQTQGYAAVGRVSAEIADAVKNATAKNPKVVIYTETEIQTLMKSKAFGQMAVVMKESASDYVLPPSDIGVPVSCQRNPKIVKPPTVPPLLALSTAVGLLDLFKKDRTLEGSTITIDAFALTTSIIKALKAQGVAPYYPPSFFALAQLDFGRDEKTKIYNSAVFQQYEDLRTTAARLVQGLSAYDDRKAAIEAATADKKYPPSAQCKTEASAQLVRLAAAKATATQISSEIADLIATVIKVDGDTGQSQLVNYMLAERFSNLTDGAFILQVKAIAAGGTTQTTKSLFSSKVSFSGGAIVSYLLLDAAGTPVLADTVPFYTGFTPLEKMSAGRTVFPSVKPPDR
jgi:hypothetical protein